MPKNARLNNRNIYLLLITAQPVFISRKINQDPKEEEKKPQIECVALFIVFNVTCVMQVMWLYARTLTYLFYI